MRAPIRVVIIFLIVSLCTVAGGFFALRDGSNVPATAGSGPPVFSFYTSPGATSPQIPLFAAVDHGRLKGFLDIRVEVWNDVDSLKTLMLGGKGDFWLGHTESFAYARKQGAPVSLLVISAWKKNYIVTTDTSIRGWRDLRGKRVGFAPKGSSAVSVLKALLGDEAKDLDLEPYEANQLASDLSKAALAYGVVPEPIVTLLLHKVPGLKALQNLEEEYSKAFLGGLPVPVAGIAMNAETARKYPRETEMLRQALMEEGASLAKGGEDAASLLPEEFEKAMPRQIVRESLARDMIAVASSCDVSASIQRYLETIDPVFAQSDAGPALDAAFFGCS